MLIDFKRGALSSRFLKSPTEELSFLFEVRRSPYHSHTLERPMKNFFQQLQMTDGPERGILPPLKGWPIIRPNPD